MQIKMDVDFFASTGYNLIFTYAVNSGNHSLLFALVCIASR